MPQRAFAVFFLIVALSFSFAVWSANAATAPMASETITTPSALVLSSEPEATESAQEEYTLPHPGILPDHPLYKVKLLRDRVLDFLIRDPIKRIEFNLLMSDKRLMMGMYLADKEKYELSEETVSKGEKYFVNALSELQSAKDEGRSIRPDIIDNLRKSAQKHQDVIEALMEKSPERTQSGYRSSWELAVQNVERAEALSR